jgi:hypothetical protein
MFGNSDMDANVLISKIRNLENNGILSNKYLNQDLTEEQVLFLYANLILSN